MWEMAELLVYGKYDDDKLKKMFARYSDFLNAVKGKSTYGTVKI